MKAVAGRARDVANIENLLDVHAHLDLDWVRSRLTEFDRALERTEIVDEFDRILARSRSPTNFDDSD